MSARPEVRCGYALDSDQNEPTHTFWTRELSPHASDWDSQSVSLVPTRTRTHGPPRSTSSPAAAVPRSPLPAPSLPPARLARCWSRCAAAAARRGSTDRSPGGTVGDGGEEEAARQTLASPLRDQVRVEVFFYSPSPRATRAAAAAAAVASYFSFPPNPAHSFLAIAQFAVMTSQAKRWEWHLEAPKVFWFFLLSCFQNVLGRSEFTLPR